MPALQRAVQLQQLQEGASLVAAPYLPVQGVSVGTRASTIMTYKALHRAHCTCDKSSPQTIALEIRTVPSA